VSLHLLLAILATLGCVGWVAYVLAPSARQAPPRCLGWLVLLAWGGAAIALVGAGVASGYLIVTLLGVALALALAWVRPRVIERLGGPDRRWALARAWEALEPVRTQEHPDPSDAAWARVILRQLDPLRTPATDEFIDLLQSHLRAKLDGEPGIDPAWSAARLEDLARQLFGPEGTGT
jgi:hypothetical protein